jgi:plasmid segregation protein ParM
MIVGVDIGYGYTKAVGDGRPAVFPSVVGKAERIRYENDVRLTQPAARQEAECYGREGIALITEEGDRFVGELALLQSRVQWTLLDRSRVEDPSARLLFMAALSELAGEQQEPCSFQVVTGLPVKWYADRDKVVQQFQGRHFVRRVNGRTIMHRFTVPDVLVVPQPFGSLFSTILGPDGQIVDEELARGRLAVIDVGTYTTDYVLVDRLRYVERGSSTLASAMSKAYQLIGRSILDTFGLDLRMHEVDQSVREGQVTVFGERKAIDWLVAPVLDALSAEILAEAGSLWGDGRDLTAILVTGGGAMALGERIGRRYAHARVLEDAALANVRGFRRYGLRKWGAREE